MKGWISKCKDEWKKDEDEFKKTMNEWMNDWMKSLSVVTL